MGRYEGLFYPILNRYGFQGSRVKDQDYLDEFDAAVRKWGKSQIYSQKFSSVTQNAPPQKPKSREEQRYDDAQLLYRKYTGVYSHGYGRGTINDDLASAGLMDDLVSHGFERARSWTNSEVYQQRASTALDQFIDRYQKAHHSTPPTAMGLPTPGQDLVEFRRVMQEIIGHFLWGVVVRCSEQVHRRP